MGCHQPSESLTMATLSAATDYRVMDNLVAVTVTNANGDSASTDYALKRNVVQRPIQQGEVEVWHTTCRWHVWKTHMGTFVPQQHGYVTDPDGAKWYIDDVSYDTWESRFALSCTLQAGAALQ